MRLGALTFWTRDSGGALNLASYHPSKSPTWYWVLTIKKLHESENPKFWVCRSSPERRHGQWHTYIWLPLRRSLIISRQDYHKLTTVRRAA